MKRLGSIFCEQDERRAADMKARAAAAHLRIEADEARARRERENGPGGCNNPASFAALCREVNQHLYPGDGQIRVRRI